MKNSKVCNCKTFLILVFINFVIGWNNSVYTTEIENSLNVKVYENYFVFEITIHNAGSDDMYIPLREWFFNGRVKDNETVYQFGQQKTINGITYISRKANQKLLIGGGFFCGELDYSTEIIPKLMVIEPGQSKKLEIQIDTSGVIPGFFEQDAYNIEIELAVADNKVLYEFYSIFPFDFNKYVVDTEVYKLKLNQHKKYKHYFTSKEYDSKKKFDNCLKNVFYLVFRNHITIKGELILKK